MKHPLGTIVMAWLWLCLALVAQAAPAQEFMLDNGMKIIVKEDHRAPTVAHMVWYRVGAVDEKNGTTGVAHALEHMMFKGTKTLKAGEFSRRVAELGGRENAFTSSDYTAYFQQIEKSHLSEVMALEADRMANLVFDASEFSQEIKVVMEERRLRTDDQPGAQVYEALNAATFVAHPYHHPVVGWMNDLQNMTVQDVKAWYDAWYAPNNATLIVAGRCRCRRGAGAGHEILRFDSGAHAAVAQAADRAGATRHTARDDPGARGKPVCDAGVQGADTARG